MKWAHETENRQTNAWNSCLSLSDWLTDLSVRVVWNLLFCSYLITFYTGKIQALISFAELESSNSKTNTTKNIMKEEDEAQHTHTHKKT